MSQSTAAKTPAIDKNVMEGLRRREGNWVSVEYVSSLHTTSAMVQGTLGHVQTTVGSQSLKMGNLEIQFVGQSKAIRTISTGNKTVYDNRENILEGPYNPNKSELHALRQRTFGERNAKTVNPEPALRT
jgi:hypothetical protein